MAQPRRTSKTKSSGSVAARQADAGGAERSGRYTPPGRRQFRIRPGWHKGVGGALVVLGAALFFVCQLRLLGIHDYGGHVWYLVGFAIAGYGTWWFGWYDPAT